MGTVLYHDYQPIDYVDVGPYPFGPGVVYQTGVIARILPNGSIDFMENTGRTVLTDGAHGRRYFDLKKAEKYWNPAVRSAMHPAI